MVDLPAETPVQAGELGEIAVMLGKE